MKLLLNNKEIAHFLISLIDHQAACQKIVMNETNLVDGLGWALEKRGNGQFIPQKFVDKAKDKIRRSIELDLANYVKNVKTLLDNRQNMYYESMHDNIEYFIQQLGTDKILDLYKKSRKQNFVKSVGHHIDKNSTLIRRKDFSDLQEDCLIRNTVGNEQLLLGKIHNNYPFWFIDSGYTNFLEPSKKWHRLIRNHLHRGNYSDTPADRLQNLVSFPAQWRTDGEIICVIEPGPFAADIFHVDVKTWKYQVEKQLRQHTDKRIQFREKANKKVRSSFYQDLLSDDYYCVVNINSNAATESIWAGVPAITLDRHVTNHVTKNNLADINNLYRGSLGNWLCYLSYNQFTYDELISGRACEMIKKYHG